MQSNGSRQRSTSFNPRLPTGGDASSPALLEYCTTTFQSTPPHGRRQYKSNQGGCAKQFQSTPPHGRRRFNLLLIEHCRMVSIHASPREATCLISLDLNLIPRFQSTPPHGRRPAEPGQKTLKGASFNPRLPTGGDILVLLPRRCKFCFNPRLPTGGDKH